MLEEPGIDEPKLSFVCVTSTWDWLSKLSNLTEQWPQCTNGLACYSYLQFTSLCTAPGDPLDPSLLGKDVEGKVLFMEPRDDPIPLSADDLEITFKGFGHMSKLHWMTLSLTLAK